MIKYISFGKMTSTHGLLGAFAFDCFFGNTSFFFERNEFFIKEKNEYIPIKLQNIGKKKDGLIIKLEGVEKIEDATPLLKKEIYITRELFEELPSEEGKHFVEDLIGLEIRIEGMEEPYGEVLEVVNFGAGPLLEVAIFEEGMGKILEKGKEKLEYYEKSENIIKEVNILGGYILLKEEALIKG